MANSPATPGQNFYPITGIIPNVNQISNRRDIETWFEERETNAETAIQVTLFILAMKRWYLQPVDDELSYFRIAGIHGQPYGIPWDQTDNTNGVFCVHGQPTFPTFHRVYLTLYEQRLHEIMREIVDETFPTDTGANKEKNEANNTAWLAAADNWRLPYWDWTTNALPLIATLSKISVLNPVTSEWDVPIENPMYSFRIDTKYSSMGDPDLGEYAIHDNTIEDKKNTITWPFSSCKGTNRHVVANSGGEPEWIQGTSNNDSVGAALLAAADLSSGGFSSLSDCLGRLMSKDYFTSWEQFATTKYYQDGDIGSNWLSLEQIHNAVHDMTGGSDVAKGLGHMCWVPTAAFDPIFWHHHCFIDLICAWWQSQNPTKFFDHPVETSTNPRTKKVDPDPPKSAWLKPFHSKKVEPDANWTSEKAEKISDFHYGYEYHAWPQGKGSAVPKPHDPKFSRLINKSLNPTRSTVLDTVAKHPDIKLDSKKNNDVIVNVRYNRYELNGGDPYKILFFIGDVNETIPLTQNESYVGAVYNFSTSVQQSGCANCKQQIDAGTLHTGQLPITNSIIADVLDDSIPEFTLFQTLAIEAYLKDNLSWRITAAGALRPTSDFNDLHVVVLMGNAHHSEDDSVLSSYAGYEPLFGATERKQGGASKE